MAQDHQAKTHPLSGKHIIVAGAGIAGLSFARALSRIWPVEVEPPRVTLYEKREKAVSPEREGYSMSIRSDPLSGGMQALQKLGLLNETLGASITGQHGGRGSMFLWDVNWKPILKFNQPAKPPDGLPANAMRIARYVLRQRLIDGLPSECTAHWGVGVDSASKLEDGRMKVVLSDGSVEACDLLIAADGANSKVRMSLRPHYTLQYAGTYLKGARLLLPVWIAVAAVSGNSLCLAIVDTLETLTNIYTLLITGAASISANSKFPDGLPDIIKEDHGMILGGGGASLFVSPIDHRSAVWSVSYLKPEPRDPIRGWEAQEMKDDILVEARERGKAFPEPFGQLVEASDPGTLMVFNAMDKPPVKHSEMPDIHVVFIGDSNHAGKYCFGCST